MQTYIAFYVDFVAGRRVRFYIRPEGAPNTPVGATVFATRAEVEFHPAVQFLEVRGYPVRVEPL